GGRVRPDVAAGAGHGSLELIDVADEVALAALERLLELLELRPPALHAVFADLYVRLELRLAELQVALALRQLEHPCVDDLLGDRSRSGSSRQHRPVEEGSQCARLLGGDLDAQDERLGVGGEIRFRHGLAAPSTWAPGA